MLPSLYHAHHNRYLEDLPFWLSLASQSGDPVLELGCGTGRVLIPLTRAGYRTIGLDNDLTMLQYLQSSLGSDPHPLPLLVNADVTCFHLAGTFPLVIFPCNTFTTLDEAQRRASLDCVARHLAPSGVFAVSIPNPAILENLPARGEPELEDGFLHPQTGNPVQVSSSWRRTRHLFSVTWIYDHLLPDGNVERQATQVKHHLATIENYQKEFEAVGLAISGFYGDYDHSLYTADSSQLIIIATSTSY